jgi:SOS-response transcriptional repressor LexA
MSYNIHVAEKNNTGNGIFMNRLELTEKQGAVYNFIRCSFSESQQAPTIREIASAFKMSTKAAFDTIIALERKGWIERNMTKGKARSIRIPDARIEFLSEPVILRSPLKISGASCSS